MPNVHVPAAAIGLPVVTPHSPADLSGLRFVRPDGSYDRRAIFARARALLARWNASPRAEYFYGPAARRWANALRHAWSDARSDRSTLTIRLELRAEATWRESLPAEDRELVELAAAIRNFEMSDAPGAYIAAPGRAAARAPGRAPRGSLIAPSSTETAMTHLIGISASSSPNESSVHSHSSAATSGPLGVKPKEEPTMSRRTALALTAPALAISSGARSSTSHANVVELRQSNEDTLVDAIIYYIATARRHHMSLSQFDGRVCVFDGPDDAPPSEGNGMLELGYIEQRIRAFPAGMAKLAALLPPLTLVKDEPVFAAVETHRLARNRLSAVFAENPGKDTDDIPEYDEIDAAEMAAFNALVSTVPNSLAGCAALAEAVASYPDLFGITADEGPATALVSLATGLKRHAASF